MILGPVMFLNTNATTKALVFMLRRVAGRSKHVIDYCNNSALISKNSIVVSLDKICKYFFKCWWPILPEEDRDVLMLTCPHCWWVKKRTNKIQFARHTLRFKTHLKQFPVTSRRTFWNQTHVYIIEEYYHKTSYITTGN